MLWNVFFVFLFSMCVVHSTDDYYQPTKSSAVWGYFTPPLLQRVPSKPQQTPMEAMVETTNNLGVAILQDHSLSRGNFAFSPYGVASVLVVLYEGARSESARQIHRAVKFPVDKDIIRVGFRDIHRHLRTYFSHEGYLSGINLNKQSSSLKPEYKKILKFYGYDVDLNPLLDDKYEVESENNTPNTSAKPEFNTTTVSVLQTCTTEITPAGDEKNVTNSDSENGNYTSFYTTSTSTESFNLTTQHSTEKVMSTVVYSPTLIIEEIGGTTTEPFSESHSAFEGVTSEFESTSEPEPNKPKRSETTVVIPTTEYQRETTLPTTTEQDEEFQINITVDDNLNCKSEIDCNRTDETTTESYIQTETVTEPKTKATDPVVEEITNISIDNGMLIPPLDNSKTTIQKETTTQQSFEKTTTAYFEEIEDDVEEKITDYKFNQIKGLINSRASLWLDGKPKKRKERTITDYLKSPHNVDLSLQLQNGMYDTHVSRNADLYKKLPRLLFLVDGAVAVPVPMMIYTNVFAYAYIPRLHAKALEFPLDDVRYKLLIILPVERRGLRQLIYNLADYPLSNVLETVRPGRVKAMVPTFMVEGFVILTTSLQKLGIWDVFDPRKANLSGMSTDPELYVRNVEQSVTVVIRNYVEILDIQTRTMAARQMEYEFEVTHPFLYFVLDSATNVALMAGQILDPLNSRIY